MNADANAPPLRLHSINHFYDARETLRDISLTLRAGEFLAVVGPSGCGKTTLLNIISGYVTPTGGEVERTVTTRMVYQQDGLLPWLTVGENVRFGSRHLSDRSEQTARVAEMLELVGLQGFADVYPHQLSGGMRQRIELARALAGDAGVLLLDEPFSALDYLTRLRMRTELARLLRTRPATAVVLVTHDIEEAAQLADRVLVLTESPGHVCFELTINSPRPRTPTQPEVVSTVHRILAELGLERDTSDTPRRDSVLLEVME